MARRSPSDSADAGDPLQREETTVTGWRKSLGAGLAVLAATGLAACAPQQQTRPAAASGQGMSGVQGHSMAGMDHQAMMAQCADMRRQVQQGGRLTPDMQQMMAHCDQMDRSMGSQRPR
jgi:hypothetical protein